MKKILCALLAVITVLNLTACNNNSDPSSGESNSTSTVDSEGNSGTNSDSSSGTGDTSDPDGEDLVSEYTKTSQALYDKVLGEFKAAYDKADSANSVSERYALLAIAEAKMLESGVFLPLSTQLGGGQAISRVAPGGAAPQLWGNDAKRFENVLCATDFIKSADRVEMKAKYKELQGTGTYAAWAKQFLTDKGYTLKDTYSIIYFSDPATWDILATYYAADAEAIINTYDSLVKYDVEGELKPALAESWTVSDDGLTYTFKLRSGLKWVDSQGREFADVTADDFVAGLQHMFDAQSGLSGLVDGIIKNASEYDSGDIADFSQVGVKAVDANTVEYTLEKPVSYFMTMLSYNPYAPLCRSYYESKGGKFGGEFDPSASDYSYGKDQNSILYCGPYLVTNATAKNSIVFKANASYWNKDNVDIKNINWYFSGQDDPTKPYNDCKAGTIDSVGLNDTTRPLAMDDGLFDDYFYISATDGSTGCGFFNLNRASYANANDDTKVVSTLTDEQKEVANKALNNLHFRLALCYSIDRATKNAQRIGEDFKYNNLRNSFTPGTYVKLEEDITVDINGTATAFAAGTNYGAIIQAQIDADGYPIKVYDPAKDDGLGSSDGFDGWYNVENAKAELAKAIEELKAEGVEISAENPVYIDYPFPQNIDVFKNGANVLKQSVEAALDGVIINLVSCADSSEWYWTCYYPQTGDGMNYGYGDSSLWGPDYGDPATYLAAMLPEYGTMTKGLGIF